MSVFAPLLAELDAWADSGKVLEFWWRDDDATEATEALAAMLTVAAAARVPLALAVIPMTATAELATAIAGSDNVTVWQHGIRHANRAQPVAKKQELIVADRAMLDGLRQGQDRLARLFGQRAQPVLVPPWNRIGPDLLPCLPSLGFRGLSTFKPRRATRPAPGLTQINTHADLLDWRSGAAFRGPLACIGDLIAHAQAKRQRRADPDEPTGILTHHLVMQSDAWDFLAGLFAATNAHPACAWILPDFSVSEPEPE